MGVYANPPSPDLMPASLQDLPLSVCLLSFEFSMINSQMAGLTTQLIPAPPELSTSNPKPNCRVESLDERHDYNAGTLYLFDTVTFLVVCFMLVTALLMSQHTVWMWR